MDLIPARRYKDRTRLIMAKRDKNILSAITAKRAFQGMAGLAVLCPSVLDYIGQAIKDALSALYGDLRGYSVLLPSAHSSMICPADNFFCSDICLI